MSRTTSLFHRSKSSHIPTARIASATVLHGDVANLTLTEASSMVLHGSGLDYRLENGAFVVGPRVEE